jgi:hypothetical protein
MPKSAAGCCLLITTLACLANIANAAPRESVDFARDVYPLLKRACFDCHGKEKQEGGLRLDLRKDAMRGGDSGPALVAGKAGESELVRRISLPREDEEAMPARGAPLSKSQIELVRRWIETGAKWPEDLQVAKHWAYVAPQRPNLPEVKNPRWPKTAIDHFILARLDAEGLESSPEADRRTLIRRLSLDLVGLPPTPAEIEAFLNEESPDAYERLVERLLASPEFGVRWARPWLDYARYADSHGFQRDDLRDLWPYRDWVVNALNTDMPFDQFSIEQLAGDLLPNHTESQSIATGFNRSAPTNVEAGSDPEETRINQVHDRVNTLGMVWLGATLECCQCHDHKYDPFKQRDYYGLFAFFNNTAIEADRANDKVPGSIRFLGRDMKVFDPVLADRQSNVRGRLRPIQERLDARAQKLAEPDAAWEAKVTRLLAAAPREHVLRPDDFDSLGGATHELQDDGSVLLSGEAPDKDTYTVSVKTNLSGIRAIKLETLTDNSLPGKGPGRGDATRPNFVLHSFTLHAKPAGGESRKVMFSRATADFSQKNFDVAGAIDDDPKSGWAINPKFHEPHWAIFECGEPLGGEGETLLTFELVQNLGNSRTIGKLRLLAITGDATGETLPDAVAAALKVAPGARAERHRKAIGEYRQKQDAEYLRLAKQAQTLEAELKKLEFPSTLIMEELPKPRTSMVFKRGDFRTPAESVSPTTPEVLHPLNADSGPINRLTLARWLVRRENPLVARVTVNRWWAELFGQGLVMTPEDFGVQGEPPTHPELLDWLAVEFMESGWSMKQVLRTLVLSATYRQSSRIAPPLLAQDDQNLLYARGPRFRLEAERIRDNALAISGLLSTRQGGPPIRPYQPEGVWIKVGGERYDYVTSPGEEKYRRGLYVVLKRGAPYPSFVNFDANSRLACRVKRPRSNTPLQALTLMNDPVYVEAALAFARRVLVEQEKQNDWQRIGYAFELATSRRPRAAELKVLEGLLAAQRQATTSDAAGARKLTEVVEKPSGISPQEFAAWYAVCAAILNLDETISKG